MACGKIAMIGITTGIIVILLIVAITGGIGGCIYRLGQQSQVQLEK